MAINHYQGLTESEVEASRQAHGENVLTERRKRSVWLRLLNKFADPLIIILLVAGTLSIGIACYEHWHLGADSTVFLEPAGIFVAVLLATCVGFAFEVRAEREFAVLTRIDDDQQVRVIRCGKETTVARRAVVVGDIVVLGTGDEIPADGELVEAVNLMVDESSLTGEPMTAKAVRTAHGDDQTAPAETAAYAADRMLRGCCVLEGEAVMRVTAVGDQTESGRMMEAVQVDHSVRTPLDEQLGRLSHWISVVSFGIAAAVVVGKLATYGHWDDTPFDIVRLVTYVLSAVMIAVTLIACAVPEGLPMAVTLSLALNMRRMLRTHCLVRRLHACETMGAVDVICTDKTGTLTQNRMRVSAVTLVRADGRDALIENILVNSTAALDHDRVIGNPTEGALLRHVRDRAPERMAWRDEAVKISEVPFSTERKYMQTTVRSAIDQRVCTYTKGAPEIVIAMCAQHGGNGGASEFSQQRDEIEATVRRYQNAGARTLAFARDGELTAVVAIADPVRDEVPAAIATCRSAGIGIRIITGDSQLTANEIGRQLGVDSRHITARARPLDKREIVERLRDKEGHVVAVTGDGTNDAPALRAAHVGVSMGTGTAVAKAASDVTVLDDSFSSIVQAVMWGRSLYRNLQRFILFQMTVNVVACAIVLAGSLMGSDNPLTVTQMLWVNLIMDTFAAMALASLPPTPDVMREQPRRRHAFIIDRRMFGQMAVTAGVQLAVLGTLLWLLKTRHVDQLADLLTAAKAPAGHMSAYELTIFFTTFIMLQLWNLPCVRLLRVDTPVRQLSWGRMFALISLLIVAGQVAIVHCGGAMFAVTPLSVSDWAAIVAATGIVAATALWLTRRLTAARHATRDSTITNTATTI